MNYRHNYHAGNFGDVFKHCILVMLIEALRKKEKGFCYLDTHAGAGLYDLTAKSAQRTLEYENGIGRLWDMPLKDCPTSVIAYLEIVKNLNKSSKLHYYPGSPYFAQTLLRPQDQIVLIELHPEEAKALKENFAHDKRVAIHHADGFQSVKAFLPPKLGRGLILIDPAFEQKDDYEKIISALKIAKQRFPNGTYAIWYPIKDLAVVQEFHYQLQALQFKNLLVSELAIGTNSPFDTGLSNCGMAILNAPWQFQEELEQVVNWLNEQLSN
jgi:23S rRNA (adenine2030-N6)-methyltransferase